MENSTDPVEITPTARRRFRWQVAVPVFLAGMLCAVVAWPGGSNRTVQVRSASDGTATAAPVDETTSTTAAVTGGDQTTAANPVVTSPPHLSSGVAVAATNGTVSTTTEPTAVDEPTTTTTTTGSGPAVIPSTTTTTLPTTWKWVQVMAMEATGDGEQTSDTFMNEGAGARIRFDYEVSGPGTAELYLIYTPQTVDAFMATGLDGELIFKVPDGLRAGTVDRDFPTTRPQYYLYLKTNATKVTVTASEIKPA